MVPLRFYADVGASGDDSARAAARAEGGNPIMTDVRCYEHSEESFFALVKAIEALGFDPQTASHYAYCIGDCPIKDSDGKIVVRDDHGKVIARIALSYFD